VRGSGKVQNTVGGEAKRRKLRENMTKVIVSKQKRKLLDNEREREDYITAEEDKANSRI
jgi:hypothetical protein